MVQNETMSSIMEIVILDVGFSSLGCFIKGLFQASLPDCVALCVYPVSKSNYSK